MAARNAVAIREFRRVFLRERWYSMGCGRDSPAFPHRPDPDKLANIAL
jgi:hypothetical protein